MSFAQVWSSYVWPIGVIVGLASAILTTLFVILPNLKPSTTNLVAISNVVVEPNVTFGQYLQHPSTAIE